MNSYAKYIETVIEQEPENKLLEASILYQKSFGTVPEMTYYKTLGPIIIRKHNMLALIGNYGV